MTHSGPEVLFKTCVAMKFVDDDDDDDEQQCHMSNSNSYNRDGHVRSSLNDALNSSIFICRLNAMYDSCGMVTKSELRQFVCL